MGRLRRLAWAAAIAGFALAWAAWLLAPLGWPMELARHFTPHLALAGAALAIAALLRRRLQIAGGLALTSAFFAWAFMTAPFAPVTPGHEGERITVAVFNAHADREALARFADWADGRGVDILMLAEAHGVPVAELDALYASWPHGQDSQADVTLPWKIYTTRIAVFSRHPLSVSVPQASVPGGVYDRPRLHLTADTTLGPVHVTALHPFPPMLPGATRRQRLMFEAAADIVSTHGRFLVMGDLNSTVWSPVFAALPGRRAGDPRFATTFPGFLPGGGITIDHVLIGEGLVVVDYEVGPDLGSDHRPVLAVIGAR